MDTTTLIVAALGLVSTLLASGLAARWDRISRREAQFFEARVKAYTDCLGTLHEYGGATYNRVKSRLANRSDVDREEFRQAAYKLNGSARAAIATVALLTRSVELRDGLEDVRSSIGDLNGVGSLDDLKSQDQMIQRKLDDLAKQAGDELQQ